VKNNLLLGIWRHLFPVPSAISQNEVARSAKHNQARLEFMTPEHHRVRNLVVRELPRIGTPLTPDWIAHQMNLPIEKVVAILDDLEKNMTFLFRNTEGAVAWAYPVTVEPTPHRVTLSTGEQIYAAWGIDAIAVPFVQGQLRQEHLSARIETVCVHCRQPIRLDIDSDLAIKSVELGAEPLIFAPLVNFETLKDPSIIDAF